MPFSVSHRIKMHILCNYSRHSRRKDLLKKFPSQVPLAGFYKNNKINATAGIFGEAPVFLMTNAAFFILHDLFNRILSYKNTFVEVGDSSVERLTEPSLINYSDNLEDLYCSHLNCTNREYSLNRPVNTVRVEFANFLTFLAGVYLFEHELCHFLNGHILFSKRKNGLGYIEEYSEQHDGYCREEKLINQTLEYDADCIAMNRCIADCFLFVDNSDAIYYEWKEFCKCKYDVIYYLTLAVQSLHYIRIIREIHYGVGDIKDNAYPTHSMRADWCARVTESFVKKRHKDLDVEKIKKKIEEGLRDSFSYYTVIVRDVISPSKTVDGGVGFLSNEELIQMSEIQKCWSNIRDNLQEHAFVNLAP